MTRGTIAFLCFALIGDMVVRTLIASDVIKSNGACVRENIRTQDELKEMRERWIAYNRTAL